MDILKLCIRYMQFDREPIYLCIFYKYYILYICVLYILCKSLSNVFNAMDEFIPFFGCVLVISFRQNIMAIKNYQWCRRPIIIFFDNK